MAEFNIKTIHGYVPSHICIMKCLSRNHGWLYHMAEICGCPFCTDNSSVIKLCFHPARAYCRCNNSFISEFYVKRPCIISYKCFWLNCKYSDKAKAGRMPVMPHLLYGCLFSCMEYTQAPLPQPRLH